MASAALSLKVASRQSDGGAALGRNDGVDRVFEDEDAVGDGKAERAAGAAFAGDDGDGGDAEAGHFAHVAGDGLCLAALFGADARIGGGHVDEGEDGAGEFLGDFHAAEGLAVALRVGHAEAAADFVFGGAAFEVGDDHDFLAVEAGHAAGHRGIVAEGAVAVNFGKVGANPLDEVHGIGPLGVTCQLSFRPFRRNRRRIGVGRIGHRGRRSEIDCMRVEGVGQMGEAEVTRPLSCRGACACRLRIFWRRGGVSSGSSGCGGRRRFRCRRGRSRGAEKI